MLSTGNALPTPAAVDLPVPGVPSGDLAAATAEINAYFEPFEGMLVSVPRHPVGERVLRAGALWPGDPERGRPPAHLHRREHADRGRLHRPRDRPRPAQRSSSTTPTTARTARSTPRTPPTTTRSRASAPANFFRGGDTITNLTGVLHWSFAGGAAPNAWRIRPVTEAYDYAFTPVNTRPAVPDVGGSLKVASFNVLNYFLTIDTSNVCAPTQNQDCRGADSALELERQRTKMLAALTAIDADVFGFMEMENTPDVEPLADIVAGLPGLRLHRHRRDRHRRHPRRHHLQPGQRDARGRLTPSSTRRRSSTRAASTSTATGRPLAQTFEEDATGARFTVVVNHLKSKGSGCGAGDDDTTTGPGQLQRHPDAGRPGAGRLAGHRSDRQRRSPTS